MYDWITRCFNLYLSDSLKKGLKFINNLAFQFTNPRNNTTNIMKFKIIYRLTLVLKIKLNYFAILSEIYNNNYSKFLLYGDE